MIRACLVKAEVTETVAFNTPETLEHLCRMSGSHARNLLILLHTAYERALTIDFKTRFQPLFGLAVRWKPAKSPPIAVLK